MKGKLKYIVSFVFLIFLLFLYGFSVERNNRKKVKEVEVKFDVGENQFLTHQEVDELLKQSIDSIKNVSKKSVNLHNLEKKVLENPYVEKASVYLTLDGDLKIFLKQRKPLARVVNSFGSYYIDKYGVKILLSSNFSSRVPLVAGIKVDDDINEIMKLIDFILDDEFLKKEIVGIERTPKGEYIFDIRSGDYKIEFGKFINEDIKVKKMKAFYNNISLNNLSNKYKKVNVKYNNQIVCTKI